MAAVANFNTKRYSWWWDSHNIPKNSKWLQDNLTDMDSKVKQMIKVIEEDADSFARRAEMYYKKRPELMKLVEEFYRAYRALAERYDHATGVLRHAQQTMAEAFPNQDHTMMFGEELLVASSTEDFDPQTPESYPPIRAPIYPSDLQKDALGISSSHLSTVKRNIAFMEDTQSVSYGKGLKIAKARKGLSFSDDAKVLSESERASKAEAEIVALKDALSKVQAEKEANLAQFDHNLERLANLESEVSRAQEDSRGFNERATRAEAEVETLRETLSKLEVEKGASLLQYQQCLQNIADLEDRISLAQKEAGEVEERASQAEAEIAALKQSVAGSETDKEAALVQYRQCLETISNLEVRLRKAEEDARLINQRAENADGEVESLKQKVSILQEKIQELEAEVELRVDQRNALQQEIYCLKEELSQIGKKHQSMVDQVELVGLHPEGLASSIKGLQEENSRLKETKERESIEKTALLEKLELMENLVQKNLLLESATENSKKLSEENRLLENSLFVANAELEELKSNLRGND